MWNKTISTLLVLIALLAGVALPTRAQTTLEDGQGRDAQWYAARFGVPLDEARQRLRLQESAGALEAILSARAPDSFAGLWIEHTPRFRVVVQSTVEEGVRPYLSAGALAGRVESRRAGRSLARLSAAREEAARAVRLAGIQADVAANVPQNRVEVYVTSAAGFGERLAQAGLTLPPEATVVEVATLMRPQADLYGGLGLTVGGAANNCTAGFAVRDGAGNRYITTAAHCGNSVAYGGTGLGLKGEVYGGALDLQWHLPGTHTPRNQITTGGGSVRAITGSRSRNGQTVGEVVCKHGVASGYTCGTIRQKDYIPSYVPGASANFIRVESSSAPISLAGDSGAPWFSGNTAYGIHSGGDGGYTAIYMPIDFINGQGLSLLTS
ncbi:MAG TPA: S1 family peptidase [Roseiflexaceae bacterium]|nr:S1 family peptidase [Roseiflexaceae bacterium]